MSDISPAWPTEDPDASPSVIEKVTRLMQGNCPGYTVFVYHVEMHKNGEEWLASVLCVIDKLEYYYKVSCNGRSIYAWMDPIFSPNSCIRGMEIA